MVWTRDMAKDDTEAALFRELSDTEEEAFRKHAREEFEKNPDIEINPLWHPVVRQEFEALKRGI